MREVAYVQTLNIAVVVDSDFAGQWNFDGFSVEVVVVVVQGGGTSWG